MARQYGYGVDLHILTEHSWQSTRNLLYYRYKQRNKKGNKQMNKSYESAGYTMVEKILANLDKCSKHGHSNVVNSPFGIFKMYDSNTRGRFYSLSKSTFWHCGGSLKMSTIRNRFTMIFS